MANVLPNPPAGGIPFWLPQTTFGRFLIGCAGGATILCPLFVPVLAPFLAAGVTGVNIVGLPAATGAQALLTLTGGIWAINEPAGPI